MPRIQSNSEKVVVEFVVTSGDVEHVLKKMRDFLISEGVSNFRFKSYRGKYKKLRCKYCGGLLQPSFSRRIHEQCRGKMRKHIRNTLVRHVIETGDLPPPDHPLYVACHGLFATTPGKIIRGVGYGSK